MKSDYELLRELDKSIFKIDEYLKSRVKHGK